MKIEYHKIEGNNNSHTKFAPWKEFKVNGKIVKQDDRYIVEDNTTLNNLVLSSTRLNPGKETTGHKHKGHEEIYFFVSGGGEMELDKDKFSVEPGDIVLVKDGAFHKVYNTSKQELYFICVLQGERQL